MRRINQILDTVPEIVSVSPGPKEMEIKGGMEFREVTLTHPGQPGEALKGISLTIRGGQTVALVGRVGSGKSTLLQTLPRLFDLPRGAIFFDGIDIHDIPLKTLRESLGFVTQEVIVFSDTIRNNVIFGREGISEETLVQALKTAQIYDEVMSLEKGLDTLLGERGITLSGGQRQRLSIARAVISNPPILIMDDALSMVDTRTEERILNQILLSRQGKTNLIVSHRLSTISRADIIVVLDGGRLAEVGDHKALLERGEEYARIYRRQLLAQELEMGAS